MRDYLDIYNQDDAGTTTRTDAGGLGMDINERRSNRGKNVAVPKGGKRKQKPAVTNLSPDKVMKAGDENRQNPGYK